VRSRVTYLAVLIGCIFPAPAGAATILDRVQVGVPGDRATRGYDDALSIALVAPASYGRGCCYNGRSGEWLGPRYAAATNASFGNASRIGWGVTFERSRRSSSAIAASAGWAELPELSRGAQGVAHVVAGRSVGRLRARFALDAADPPDARVQAALAITLGRRLRAVVVFDLTEPATDDGGPLGPFSVGGVPASSWNRAEAQAALAGVYVEGSLPPARVRARAAKGRIRGSVSDALGHPVSGARIALERRAGRAWRTAGRGTTTSRGGFALRAARSGSYRVIASLSGTRAKSRAVRQG
jgi:hypothetical protein